MTLQEFETKLKTERQAKKNKLSADVENLKEQLKNIDADLLAATIAEDARKEKSLRIDNENLLKALDVANRELELYSKAFNGLIAKDLREVTPWLNEQIARCNTLNNYWENLITQHHAAIAELKKISSKLRFETDSMIIKVSNYAEQVDLLTADLIDKTAENDKYLNELKTNSEFKTEYKITKE